MLKYNNIHFFLSLLFFLFSIGAPLSSPAQSREKFTLRETGILLDSTYGDPADKTFLRKLHYYHDSVYHALGVVIGQSSEMIESFYPESPLSNLLTDWLLDYGIQYMADLGGAAPDLSLLNFGGIRNVMPAGDIQVTDLYAMLPFDNKVVILTFQGSELKKIFTRFTANQNQAYSGLEMEYLDNRPVKITLHGEPIRDDKIYTMVTVDFIQGNGDEILDKIEYGAVVETHKELRQMVMEKILQLTAEGKMVTSGGIDNRASIIRQIERQR